MKKTFAATLSIVMLLLAFYSNVINVSAATDDMDTKAFDVNIKVRETMSMMLQRPSK